VADENLRIERVLRVSLMTVILSGATVVAVVALFLLLS
jgi:hypothetical protein